MSHPDYENQNASAAESIEPEDEIRDLRKHLADVTAERNEYKAIAAEHVRQHDANCGHECDCTLCHRTQAVGKGAKSCCECGFAADATHEGAYYCVRCFAERKACEQEHVSDTRLDR